MERIPAPSRQEPAPPPEIYTVEQMRAAAMQEQYDLNGRTGNTVTTVLPVYEPRLRNHHILPPGAGGPHGRHYKLLRTQVAQRLEHAGANTLAVMSPRGGCGSTTTAMNLAIAMAAELGRTALLVDLNLRSPALANMLGLNPRVGVEKCITESLRVDEVLVRLQGYERLALLPARQAMANSSELLNSTACRALVHELRTRYSNRVVIFDLPPVLESDDALVFAGLVQTGLMVVGEGRTRTSDLAEAVELLRDFPLLGTVLNTPARAAVAAD
jgi:Mrp family chromosome partitioning ATPase